MDAYITRIENSCNDMALDFSITECGSCYRWDYCDNFDISEFEWRTINKKNNFYSYEGLNGGYGTCMREDKKIVSLKILITQDCIKTRTILRKKVEKLFSSNDCCGDCCPLRVYFTDWDGEEYYFDAQAGSSTTVDNFQDSTIMVEYSTALEVCDNVFYNANTNTCCGVSWSVGGFRMPFTGCSCISWDKYLFYEGIWCADYTVSIKWEQMVNPRFFNLSKNSYYGIDWTFSWEIIIDTRTGITYNGNRVPANSRQSWSSLQWIGLKSWENNVLLTLESWTAEWCLEYWNNII